MSCSFNGTQAVEVFSVYRENNTHIAIEDYYATNLTCDVTSATIRDTCLSDEKAWLSLYRENNTHIGHKDYYTKKLCVSPNYTCYVNTTGDCGSGETETFSVNKTNNTHIGSVDYYDYAFCCKQDVVVFIDIIPSSDLDDGIQFGNVDPSTNDNPATKNSDCTSGTCYNITIDPATIVSVDLYHKTSGDLGSILIGNVTHQANITDNNGDNLIASGSIPLTTSYVIIGTDVCQNLGDNDNCWIKYWFDVPSGQSPGDLETTYEYCGVETGQGSGSCG